jgi:OOP family OmpA-OmpF porin
VGYNLVEDETFDFRGTSTALNIPTANSGIASENEYKGGLIYNLVLGYEFANGFRPEFELVRRQNDVDEIKYPDTGVSAGVQSDVEMKASSAFFNLWYDFFPSGRAHPYLGLGYGITRLEVDAQPNNRLVSGAPVAGVCLVQDCSGPRKADDDVGTLQLGAGVRFDATSRLTFGLDYRYIDTEKAKFYPYVDQPGTKLEADYQSHSVMLSAVLYFSQPEPPPPPPVEAPPVVAAAAVCSDGQDNDGDGKIDYPNDPGCSTADDGDETDPPVCSDGIDNDGDGLIDFPADKGCESADDLDETDPCKTPAPGERISLDGCGTGDIIVLRGVNFEFDKSRLTPNAKLILDEVAEALVANPQINVEISGHTDSMGSDEYNQRLSESRAASVVAYLVEKGVAAERMTSAGYGESQPVADNSTDEGREANRRVELKVMGSSM